MHSGGGCTVGLELLVQVMWCIRIYLAIIKHTTLQLLLNAAEGRLMHLVMLLLQTFAHLRTLLIECVQNNCSHVAQWLQVYQVELVTLHDLLNILPVDPNRCALVSRSQLALNLLYEAARHPSISIYFGASPTAIDVADRHISLERTSSHTDDSTLVLEHLLHQQSPMRHAESAGALEQDSSVELSVGGDITAGGDSAVATQQVAEPEKLMSTTRMAGMQTAIALQARQGAEEPLPESLGYDFLVGADGAFSKVCCNNARECRVQRVNIRLRYNSLTYSNRKAVQRALLG